jgi:adenylate cyclase
MFHLIYSDKGATRRVTLPQGDTVIGRGNTSDLFINDATVSRVHARVRVTRDKCTVTDLGSRRGVFRNGAAIAEAELEDGDRLMLGDVEIKVEHERDQGVSIRDVDFHFDSAGTIFLPVDSAFDTAPSIEAGRLLHLMSEIAKTLVKVQPLDDIFICIVDLTLKSIPAEHAILILNDETSGVFVAPVARRRDGSISEQVTVSETVIRMVTSKRVAVLTTDAQSDRRFASAPSIQIRQARSLMCAPLWNQSEIIGFLYVDNPLSQKFSAADLELLTALAHYAGVAIDEARLTNRVQQEMRRRERLQQYHSAAVVERILETSGSGELIAQERDVSVLFADLVHFTAMAEAMSPSDVATLLNAYFSRMVDVIFEQEGMLDKFMGDGILAVFGAPFDQPDHALRSVHTARAMRRALAAFNAERVTRPLQVRIAISSGVVMVGDIGSTKRREYTVLGDVVNTASRIESSFARPDQIVIARSTYDHIHNHVNARPLGYVTLRGRQEPVELFEVED